MKNNKVQNNITVSWQKVKLGDISNVYDGTHQTPTYTEAGVPFYSVEHVTSNNFNDTKFVSEAVYEKESKRIKMEKGDILMTRIGDVGTAKYIDWDPKASFYVSLALIKCKKDVNSKFINFVINSDKFKNELRARTLTVAFPNKINLGDISKCNLYVPIINEQNRIVSVLETWDKAIEKLAKKIEVKKQIKKGLMQDLLTGKKRLKEFSDKWKTVELGDVSDFINGYTFKSSSYCENGNYKIITIANVQDGFMFIEGSKTIKELPLNVTDDQVLKKGDVLISMTGNVGRVCVVNNDNCLLNQRVGKIKAKGINQELLYLMLHDRRFLNKMIDSAQGGAQANLSTGDIKEYIVDIPQSKEEQAAIAKILTTADREIDILKRKLKVLKEQKRYLLNNLITGTIRTPETLSTKLIK